MRPPDDIIEDGKGTQFSSDNQPARNGRKAGPITQFLREYGEADALEITIKKFKDGKWSEPNHASISTDGKQTINQAIATRLLQLALTGDMKAIKEVLNRTEGRVPQPIKLGGDSDNPLGVMIMMPENGRLDPLPSNIPPLTDSDEKYKRLKVIIMNVEDIPANEVVIMTPELYQEFCQGGCVPACHFTNEWINIGDKFHLSTVKVYGEILYNDVNDALDDKDVMLSESVTIEQYNQAEADKYYADKKAYYDKKNQRRGGCFRVNGKIVI